MSYRSYPISGPPALVLKNETVIAADPEYADRYNAIESATDIDQRVAITLASLQLVILGYLIWKERRHLPLKKHKFFTVINSLLAAMIIAHGLNPFFDLLRTQVEDVDPKVAPVMTLSSLSAFFQFLLNFLVMVYAWKRGHPVIQLLRPSIQPYMITVLIFFAFLLLSQFIATVLDTYVLSYTDTLDKPEKLRTLCTFIYTCSILINLCMISFDVLVSYFYVVYLRSMAGQVSEEEIQKLRIISRYGIVSCVFLEGWMAAAVADTYRFHTISRNPSNMAGFSTGGLMVIIHGSRLGCFVFLFIQLGMKWALMVEDQRRDVAKFDRVANAKQLVSDKNYSLEKKVAEKSVGLSVSDNATV